MLASPADGIFERPALHRVEPGSCEHVPGPRDAPTTLAAALAANHTLTELNVAMNGLDRLLAREQIATTPFQQLPVYSAEMRDALEERMDARFVVARRLKLQDISHDFRGRRRGPPGPLASFPPEVPVEDDGPDQPSSSTAHADDARAQEGARRVLI